MTWRDMDSGRSADRSELTPDDIAALDDVLDAAAAFACGMLPFQQAAAIGALADWRGNPSPSYTRYVAATRTPKSDPRWSDLMTLLDTLITAEGYVVTRQGTFTRFEIRANEAGWQYANLDRSAA